MAQLIYNALASLAGYVADEAGNIAWGEPNEDLATFTDGIQRQVGT